MIIETCEHGEAKRHWVNPGGVRTGYAVWDGSPWQCLGGRVLEQAIIIERTDGEWPAWAMACATYGWYAATPSKQALLVLDALASAQEQR